MRPETRDQTTHHLLVSCLLSLVSCLFLTSCIRRNLTIRSEPPGARLIVNDKDLGTTPLSYDFEWYGSYRISLTKDGYERLDDQVRLRAPMYFWIPVDLVVELLPFKIRDTKALSYTLTPKTPLPTPTLPASPLAGPVPSEPSQAPSEEAHGQAR